MNCMEVWGGNGSTQNHFTRPGLDVWIWSQSRQDTAAGGGDLHLISSCASGRITRTLLADVCGFGPIFSDIAGQLRDLMKRNVNSIRQARAVRQMSCHLERASSRGGFASTLISTYFSPTRSLTVCNAGHPPPLLFSRQSGEWSILKESASHGSPSELGLGVVDPNDYQHFQTRLELGDLVLSFSNALTECRRHDGRTIGLVGLLDRVGKLDAATPSLIPEQLVAQIKDEHDANLADDDATLLLCQATETPVAWQDNMLAPFRLLQSVADRTTF